MFSFLLDLLFPPHCLHCQALGEYMCDACLSQQRFYTKPLAVDLDQPAIDQLYACCTHTHLAQKLVHTLKYRSSFTLAQIITQLMIEHIPFPNDIDTFVPIPLHPSRQRRRGFNQAALLTKHLSAWMHIACNQCLSRTRATSPQAELNRNERLTHITGAFTFIPQYNVKNKVVAIVDDVATTGTTLNEAAKVLKQHGAKKVYGVVFAHGK